MKKLIASSLGTLGCLILLSSQVKGGPIGPPAGTTLSPNDVILTTSTKQAGKTFNVSSATVDNLNTSTITANRITIGGVPISTSIVSGTSVYPATGTIHADKGIIGTTATFTGEINGTTVTLTGIINGAVIHGSSLVITGTISGSNVTGTNTGDVTIGNGTGISLSGQVISLATATSAQPGALTSADWTTFNTKLSTTGNGSGLTGLTKSQVGLDKVQNVDQTIATNVVSGVFDPARLGTGTATTSKYMRGDSFWAVLNSTAAGLGNVTNDKQIKVSDYTQKGGILVGIGTGTFSLLPPNTNGWFLRTNSAKAEGVEWIPISSVTFSAGITASSGTFTGPITGTTISMSGSGTFSEVITSTITVDKITTSTMTTSVMTADNGTVTNMTATNLTVDSLSGILKASAGSVAGSATTTDVPEGSNLYYTVARTTSDFSATSPLLYSNGAFSIDASSVTMIGANPTTTKIPEGSNLYYTLARTTSAFTASAPVLYANGVFSVDKTSVTLLGTSPSTTFLTEGSKLFFTTARATSTISATNPITYANGVIGINTSSITLQGNTFNGNTQLVQTTSGGALPSLTVNSASGTITQLYSTTATITNLVNTGNYFNVKNPPFNAMGNGTSTDTLAIQAADNACSAAHSALYFPPGVYLSTQIVPGGNCAWFGAGKYISTIMLPQQNINPMNFSLLRVSTPIANWSMQNMGLVGNRAFQTTTFSNGANSGYAVLLESGPVNNIFFDQIYISSFGAIGAARNTGGGSILVAPAYCPDSSVQNFRVTNSVFGNNDKLSGVYIDGAEGSVGGLSRDIFITGNSFQGGYHNNTVYTLGNTTQGSTTQIFYNVHIDGNSFYNTEDSDANVEVNGTQNFTVNNNNYVMTTSGVAQMLLVRSNCKNGSWSFNNVISYSSDTSKPSLGIVAFNPGEYQDNIVVEGNTIIMSTATSGVIKVLKGSRHVQVKNNIFISSVTAASNFVQIGEATDVDVTGNQFENIITPIILSEGTFPVTSGINMSNNRFRNCGASGGAHISSMGGTISLTNITIDNNRVDSPNSTSGGAVFAVLAAAANTGNILSNNKIYGGLALTDATTEWSSIYNNVGYNPVGAASISVGGSPFTYTAGVTDETVYVTSGTVSSITVGGVSVSSITGTSVYLPYGHSMVVTYSVAPTMNKYIH